jgi:hypothetical protein
MFVEEAPEVELPLELPEEPEELPELPEEPEDPEPLALEVDMPLAADAEDVETRLAIPFEMDPVATQLEVAGCEKAAEGVVWPSTPFVYETATPLFVNAPVKYCWKVEVEPSSRT